MELGGGATGAEQGIVGGVRRLPICVLVGLMLLLAGCGGSSSNESSNDSPSQGEAAGPRTAATATEETEAAEARETEADSVTGAPKTTGPPRTVEAGASAAGRSITAAAGELVVTFLDVGQGNSALLELPGGENVLVDGGPTEAGPLVVRRLGELGIRELDAVVLSHADEDHVGGLADVLEAVPVQTVYDSAYPHGTGAYEDFLAAVEESGARYVGTRAGDTVREDSPAELEFIYPDELGEGTNESSLVLDLTYGDFDALFMGDAEQDQEEDLLAAGRVPDVELLQVGHHGSSGATSEKFLQAASPEAAVIQVGADNSLRSPDPGGARPS